MMRQRVGSRTVKRPPDELAALAQSGERVLGMDEAARSIRAGGTSSAQRITRMARSSKPKSAGLAGRRLAVATNPPGPIEKPNEM